MKNIQATNFLNSLKRITPDEINNNFGEDVLLLPQSATIEYLENCKVKTTGINQKVDLKSRDLLRMVHIYDALNIGYEDTNIIMPRTYAESLSPIPQHISVQCILLSKVKETDVNDIMELSKTTIYGKTFYDNFWIDTERIEDVLKPDTVLYIMNRRIGGWDGTPDRPVIELLGAGGHLPLIWQNDKFVSQTPIRNILNEIQEEVGLTLEENQIEIFGGFHNETSNELVILSGVFIDSSDILYMQKYALGNYEQDTDGIYIGRLNNVINNYLDNAEPFAGGEKTKLSNFPAQEQLMKKVYEFITK